MSVVNFLGNNAVLTIFSIVCLCFYAILKWNYSYWQRRNIPIPFAPSLIFGHAKSVAFRQIHVGLLFKDICHKLKAKNLPYGGAYLFLKAVLVVRDLDLIKRILIKDFDSFMDRGMYHSPSEPLTEHLSSLEGDRWRRMRAKLTPTFSAAKMKFMHPLMIECARNLTDFIDKLTNTNESLDVKEIIALYTTDNISTCCFGLESNCLINPESEFRQKGRQYFESSNNDLLKNFLQFIAPSLIPILNIKLIPEELSSFFINTISQTVKYREENNIYRKDFLHLLIQLKNRNRIVDDGKLFDENGQNGLTMNELAAQAFLTFIAGFETSSTTITFLLYEIARHKNVQIRLKEEIKQVLLKNGRRIDYEVIKEMKYLDAVFMETLRLYPVFPATMRICTKNYTISDNFELKKGAAVAVPIMGIHYDNDIYKNAADFDPDRFFGDNKSKVPSMAWLAFGEGPRNCIGLRMGQLQTKTALVSILNNYTLEIDENKTKWPLEFEPFGFSLAPKGGVWMKFKKDSKST